MAVPARAMQIGVFVKHQVVGGGRRLLWASAVSGFYPDVKGGEVMGWWRTGSGGVIGDSPADVLDGLSQPCNSVQEIPVIAMQEIKNCYMEDWDRFPTEQELRELVEFCREDEPNRG